jgi:hypothetical protein
VIVLAISCGFLGFFVTAVLPLSLEAAVECSHPVPEAISGGGVMMSAQLFGIFFIVVMDAIGSAGGLTVANWLLVGAVAISCAMLVFFKEDYQHDISQNHV